MPGPKKEIKKKYVLEKQVRLHFPSHPDHSSLILALLGPDQPRLPPEVKPAGARAGPGVRQDVKGRAVRLGGSPLPATQTHATHAHAPPLAASPAAVILKWLMGLSQGETVEPVLQSKLPVGFVLGWTRTNGGFGSKADTIAKTAGKASGSR